MGADQEVSDFLNNQMALIVEPSNAFFSVIQSCLIGYKMSGDKILFASTYNEAVRMMAEFKPKILITEYMIGKHFGLSLVEKHDDLFDSLSRISIMVTKESSDNAVAEAAEEQLDAYIVKPFSAADMQKRLLEVIKRKMHPSPYVQKIREGKELDKVNNLDGAMSLFAEAKVLNPKPTLACYYLGNGFLTKRNYPSARKEFHEGLTYNELHYKCLTGEFDCLMQENQYQEAYKLAKVIGKNFPVTSLRLGKFFVAAVYTENFEDLPRLYELFTNLDFRPPDLNNLVSLALLTAGRFYIRKKNDIASAIKYFEMTANVSGRNIEIIEKIIDELLKIKNFSNAEAFLKMVRSEDLGTPKQVQLQFKVGRFILSPDAIVEMGRKIMVEGKFNPEMAKIIIQFIVDNGKLPLAESLIVKGVALFPEIRKDLYTILDAGEARAKG